MTRKEILKKYNYKYCNSWQISGLEKNASTEDSSENNEATENEVNETEKMKKENLQYYHTHTN